MKDIADLTELNLCSKVLLVKKVKSGALIEQKWVKRELESKGLGNH